MVAKVNWKRLPGMRFGQLAVMDIARQDRNGTGRLRTYYSCLCDCGNILEIERAQFKTGNQSCGHEEWGGLQVSDSQAAYLAGLVDGEGTVGIHRSARVWPNGTASRYYTPRFSIGMCSRMLIGFPKRYGVGHTYFRKTQDGWRDLFIYQICGVGLRRIFPHIMPHLVLKLPQARCVENYLRLSQHVSRKEPGTMATYFNYVDQLFEECRRLNRRGAAGVL
jgi:hypothetical protein